MDCGSRPAMASPAPTGAHPIGRSSLPKQWNDKTPIVRKVDFHADPQGLRKALDGLPGLTRPLIVEIGDSMTHDLDLTLVTDIGDAGVKPVLRLASSLWIRAADRQRPVIRLVQPLAFRPHVVLGAHAAKIMAGLMVRLEGLYLTRGPSFAGGAALIERAALNRLEIIGCTLDPGGFVRLDGTRAPAARGDAFDQ